MLQTVKKMDKAESGQPEAQAEQKSTFLNEILGSLVVRGRGILDKRRSTANAIDLDLVSQAEVLLSRRGEASGVAIAENLLEQYALASGAERLTFLHSLSAKFGVDTEELYEASTNFIDDPSPEMAQALHAKAEPKRRELFRRLNLANGGTSALVGMREEILAHLRDHENLKVVDTDLFQMFKSWFNRGFLAVCAVDWSTPASILEKIIQYEAVHEIHGWEDLRRRTEPADRRCFAFFHPALVDDPLIFVEVALTARIPGSVQDLLTADRTVVPVDEINTAVFYSISNCQEGLRGISFGNFLIKQVAQELKKELPSVTRFVTLSPVPGFAKWLDSETRKDDSAIAEHSEVLKLLGNPRWTDNPKDVEALELPLKACLARYFLHAKHKNGQPLDPVARFHLGNGARLERLNWLGDISENGLRQSHGLMVNYLYDLPSVEKNHEAFADKQEIIASQDVVKALTV